MIFKRVLGPVIAGLKKETESRTESRFYKMSTKEQMALNEARRIVRRCALKVDHPFKYGQGSLEK
jgi:hypothetical protein